VGAGKSKSPLIDTKHAVKLLGTMQGGYNIGTLIDVLDNDELAPIAVQVGASTCCAAIMLELRLVHARLKLRGCSNVVARRCGARDHSQHKCPGDVECFVERDVERHVECVFFSHATTHSTSALEKNGR
jgi:hypothetical protein